MVSEEQRQINVGIHLFIVIIGVAFFALSQVFNPQTGLESSFLEAFFVTALISIIVIGFYSFVKRKNVATDKLGRKFGILLEIFLFAVVLIVLTTKFGFTSSGAFEKGNIIYISFGLVVALVLFAFNMRKLPLAISYENTNWGRDLMLIGVIVLAIFFVKMTFEFVAPFNYLGIPFTVDAQQPLTSEPVWKFFANFFAGVIENSLMIGVIGGVGYWLAESFLGGFKSLFDPKRLAVVAVLAVTIALLATSIHQGLYELQREVVVFLFIFIFFLVVSGTAFFYVSLVTTSLAHGFIDGIVALQQQGLNEWALLFGGFIATLAIFGFVLYSFEKVKLGSWTIRNRSKRVYTTKSKYR